MKRAIFFIFALLGLLLPSLASARDFQVDSNVVYELNQDGILAKHEIFLKNLNTLKYADSFRLSLSSLEVNNLRAYDAGGELQVELLEESESQKTAVVYFRESLVGINKSRRFNVEYLETDLLKKTGEVWELSLPGLKEPALFDSYNIQLIIPHYFGDISYITPPPKNSSELEGKKVYYFDKKTLSEAGVDIAIGQYQSYSFRLTYHLENPLFSSSTAEIALPPDTPYQQVFYENISPLPSDIKVTPEGNWIAEYSLSPRERIDVQTKGYVKLFAGPRYKLDQERDFLGKNLVSNDYWQSNDPRIKKIAEELETPREIYDYVVDYLTYNYDKVSPTTKRLGALKALSTPTEAICTEFTDLFIALSRAAGIPAREVNGYAYTDNPSLQPLSLVSDVLHAWPEYWDEKRSVWVPVDPTWGHTTQGVDYFSKLDLKHFAFVMHGLSPENPPPPGSYKLGTNPQKDVFVTISELPDFNEQVLQVKTQIKDGNIFGPAKLYIDIYNPGPGAVYEDFVRLAYAGQSKETRLDVLAPFDSQRIVHVIPYGIFGNKMPDQLEIEIGEVYQRSVPVEKSQKVLKDVLAVLTFSIFVGLILFFFNRRFQMAKKRDTNFN